MTASTKKVIVSGTVTTASTVLSKGMASVTLTRLVGRTLLGGDI
jgi:hypothetical protein